MKIYDGVNNFHKLERAVVTSGTFDGVHLGHQKIINRLVTSAKQFGGESVLITFWPHPRLVLYPKQNDLQLLTDFDEKAAILASFGVDHLIKIHFTVEFSKLTSMEFINQVLVQKIGVKKLIIGYNHRFGRNREGSFTYLQEHSLQLGFQVEEIPKLEIEQASVSSTLIRKSLMEGDIQLANKLLGYKYFIQGKVITGQQMGRRIGYPTANIMMNNPYMLVPANGVYVIQVEVDGNTYGGMMNIGIRPTFDGKVRTIEAHLFDFDKSIYHHSIKVSFIQRLRAEKRFDSPDTLVKQIKQDEVEALAVLK